MVNQPCHSYSCMNMYGLDKDPTKLLDLVIVIPYCLSELKLGVEISGSVHIFKVIVKL